jgi:tetratricopeptide (TPR) repeat protein
MSDKITKKELKEPDFLQVEASKLLSYFEHHRSKIYGFLALIVAVLVVSGGWSLYRYNYDKSALKFYNQVETESLTGMGAEANTKLIAGYQSVTVKYPHSKAGLYAFYQLGNQYFQLRQYDKSIQAYDDFIKKADANNFLKIFAYTGQGYCYEEKKDYQKALGAFERAFKMPEGTELAAQIYSDMARVYGKMNEMKKAREYYGKALEKTKDRSMAEILQRRIAALN